MIVGSVACMSQKEDKKKYSNIIEGFSIIFTNKS